MLFWIAILSAECTEHVILTGRKLVGGYALDLFGLGQGLAVGSFKHGNEVLCYIKVENSFTCFTISNLLHDIVPI
jgi:hypothetical protein